MNKIFIGMIVGMLPLSAFADEVPGMLIQKNDGSKMEMTIASIRSIKFSDGQMIVNGKDDSRQTFAIGDVAQITFGSVAAAVESLTRDAQSDGVVISNISGQVVFKGKAGSANLPASLKGVYIITVDGQSHKVTIK